MGLTDGIPKITMEYWGAYTFMRDNPGMYGMDDLRAQYHDELLKYYKISRKLSKKVTDHLNRFETFVDIHYAFIDLKNGGDYKRWMMKKDRSEYVS